MPYYGRRSLRVDRVPGLRRPNGVQRRRHPLLDRRDRIVESRSTVQPTVPIRGSPPPRLLDAPALRLPLRTEPPDPLPPTGANAERPLHDARGPVARCSGYSVGSCRSRVRLRSTRRATRRVADRLAARPFPVRRSPVGLSRRRYATCADPATPATTSRRSLSARARA